LPHLTGLMSADQSKYRPVDDNQAVRIV